MDQTFTDIKDTELDTSVYLQIAVKEHTFIGWYQWFHVRITLAWGELYQLDTNKTTARVKYPSIRWGKEISKVKLNYVLDSWYIRNNCEHNLDGDQ
jgi:hypothetical protein